MKAKSIWSKTATVSTIVLPSRIAPVKSIYIAILPVMLVVLCLGGCVSKPAEITVKVQPMKVETRFIEKLKPGEKSPLAACEEALTDWKFGCKTGFDFEIVDKSELADEFLVNVRIKKATISLDAPVTIWISSNASEDTKMHEDAHVLICRRVYGEAEKTALAGAERVVKKEFQGGGSSLEAAVKEGLSLASEEICRYYHMAMVEKINRVSEIFDRLDHDNPDKKDSELVELAFQKYQLIKGNKS